MNMTQKNVSGIVDNKPDIDALSNSVLPQAPQKGRLAILLVEILLLILLAYLLVALVYQMITPRPDFLSAIRAKTQVNESVEVQKDYEAIVGFDPFYRQTANAPQTQAAPESNLKLTITGLRTDGVGGGAAIIDAQDGGQKLVTVGAEISPGINLSKVYRDRIEINRRGVRETVYMVKPEEARQETSSRISASSVAPTTSGGVSANISDIIAELRLEPVRRDGRIAGFLVTDDTAPAILQAVGLEADDIIVAVAGVRLSSFERLQELQEELSNTGTIEVEIERRGQQMMLTF